jgi:hypothetical protein
MEEALAAPGEIVVPKDTADAVSTLLSWLSEDQTQSLDLIGELVQLGPRALPVCLQQGYKVGMESRIADEVVEGLRQLAKQDHALAAQAIDHYALSSNLTVRTLCRRLSEEMGSLPACYIDALTHDDGVLLSMERLEIAEMCLRFGSDSGAMLALSKYLCREYLIGPERYQLLVKRVAGRMGEMPYSDKALLIVQDTADHIWEELTEFERVRSEHRNEKETGLLELMADTFASMGDDALNVFKAGKVPRQTSGQTPLPIFRRFAIKLGSRHSPAREWLLQQASVLPADKLLQRIAEKLKASSGPVDLDELRKTVEAFVAHGQVEDLNSLRFSPDPRLFNVLDDVLGRPLAPAQLGRVLDLLKGFQSRHRHSVVSFSLRHWRALSGGHYEQAAALLTTHGVPDRFRELAVKQLSADLGGPQEPVARDALERILT